MFFSFTQFFLYSYFNNISNISLIILKL
jgi:hypothetical protein